MPTQKLNSETGSWEKTIRLPFYYGFLPFIVPDAIVAFAACRDGHATVMRLIRREPLSFGDDQWLEENQIGSEVIALLPSGSVSIDRETEADLKRLFGVGGEYQAHKLNC